MSARPRLVAALLLLAGACAPAAPAPAPAPDPGPAPTLPGPSLVNDLGMEFVLIQPGSMQVGRFRPVCPTRGPNGSPTFAPPAATPAPAPATARPAPDPRTLWTDEDFRLCQEMAARDALPGFEVRIARPYYIGRYEVTQGEWRRVMGTNPSVFQGSRVQGDADRHPVENVAWDDAQAFVRRLNELDASARYRLPTEFEWEFAARAGASSDLTWAQIREQAQMGLTDKGTHQPVGQKRPNAWGLHDTLGNVWEWVEDYYNEKLFADPTPPTAGSTHVLRGGSFVGDVKNVTYFTHAGGPGNGWDVGFRVVREIRE